MIELDNMGFVDISVVGTKYDRVRFSPITQEIITTSKKCFGNNIPEPIRKSIQSFCNDLEWQEEFLKAQYTCNMKILKRIEKIASKYIKQGEKKNKQLAI
jgi:hypothetical protein